MGIGADEYAYVAPDPLDPNIIYGGRVMRFDKRTGQAQNVAPEALRSGRYRILRTMPLLFHPADPKQLLFATNVLWSTDNGGRSWRILSPDLSRERPDVPDSIGDFRTPELANMARRGVIYALAPSPLDVNTIWAGTDDGLVHVTRDGGTNWTDVTPPELQSWEKISQIDAGHFDVATAYIAVNSIRRSDMRAHIFRTHDGGANWKRVTSGLESAGPINVVREDPVRSGLLFAGSERSVYFSIDDGEHWNLLRSNLPPSSMRDLVIHEDDLVVGTHGRSIWILDNISPLRSLNEALDAEVYLFSPPGATRVRDNLFSDTPLPIEEPTGQNPPDGAILDYSLRSPANQVILEILDPSGKMIRRFSSDDEREEIDPDRLAHPTYWIRPHQGLSTASGHHRFVWDLRYPPPPGSRRQFSIAATYRNTPSAPVGPFVHPGSYTVRLTADGVVRERKLQVRMDPRVTIAAEDIRLQTEYSLRCYQAYLKIQTIRDSIDGLLTNGTSRETDEDLRKLRGNGLPSAPDPMYGSITETPSSDETIVGLQRKLLFLLTVFQGADSRPTEQAMKAVATLEGTAEVLAQRYSRTTGEAK